KLPKLANSHLYKQSGNSVTVPVIERIATNIANAMNKNTDYQELPNPLNGEKYAMIYLDIHGRYSGESYVVEYLSSFEEVEKFIEENVTALQPFLSNEEYIKLVKKGQSGKFYMYVEL